jgi:hypothetical protein
MQVLQAQDLPALLWQELKDADLEDGKLAKILVNWHWGQVVAPESVVINVFAALLLSFSPSALVVDETNAPAGFQPPNFLLLPRCNIAGIAGKPS